VKKKLVPWLTVAVFAAFGLLVAWSLVEVFLHLPMD
jgi:hypothetical protein